MKKLLCVLSAFIIIIIGNHIIVAQNMTPPVAKKILKKTEVNGRKLEDNYFWMRDKKNPEVINYLEDNNKNTEAVTASSKDFSTHLYDEMIGRIKQTDTSLPTKNGNYWYYNKTEEGKQYPVFYRAKDANRTGEEVLLDQNEMAKGYKFFSIAAFNVSDDGNILAFSTDTTGYRQYTLQFKDLRTGKMLPNKIERVDSVVWATDNNTLLLVTEDDVTKRSDKFWRHNLSANKTELIYEEKDELFNLGAGRSRDKKMIFMGSYAKTISEIRYLSAETPNADFKVVLPREVDHEYDADFYNGEFYIRTNKNATNFRVVSAPLSNPSNWKEFIPHNPAVKIEGTDFFAGYCAISERQDGLEYVRVIDLKSKKEKRIPTPEPVYTMGLAGNNDFNTKTIRFNYQSMVTSPSTFEYDLSGKKPATLLKQQEVLGGYDKNNYVAERQWAIARDGVKVPLSIIYKKGTKLDGTAPMLLYGYGSYGVSMTPSFSSARLSLVDRGMIYVIAHIRGGGELGEPWRQAGRMFKKITTFEDFVDCGDWLVKKQYTSSDKLVIQGGSAGGLLMGAVVNMRPDLFKAVIAQVPFVDVMNTMLDASLPLTTEEWIEWGNPNEAKAFDYMVKYSPYDNVKAQDYPNMLIEVSLNDSQVPYWEGAKFAAKIREMKTNDSQILLKTNMGAGHGGSSGRYDKLKEVAFDYAYALNQVGITK